MNKRSEEIVENILDGIEENFRICREDFLGIYKEGFEDGKKAALQWQDIETAPKEGKERDVFKRPRVLVVDKEGSISVAYKKEYWDHSCPSIGYYWGFEGDDNREISDVIGWLPLTVLPPAPEVSGD